MLVVIDEFRPLTESAQYKSNWTKRILESQNHLGVEEWEIVCLCYICKLNAASSIGYSPRLQEDEDLKGGEGTSPMSSREDPQDKKELHNCIEKKRKDVMSLWIAKIGDMLPEKPKKRKPLRVACGRVVNPNAKPLTVACGPERVKEHFQLMKNHKKLGDKAPSIRRVFDWFNDFQFGKTNLEDEPHSALPPTARLKNYILAVREKCGHWIGSNQTIIDDHIKYRKLVSRWVPHSLSEDQKLGRIKW
ncbi:hypothetical protein LAZ67_X003713 [Cordylochernes scorpioides]|uniref:Uncharacterized protein n=1 Tax=Cordylochernes scorpioides TaxID=51811 RepID=A0ABY6LUC4_9ARAC|nr:hypothetical protein LAZ67_X003713 [Cordylochernes scorpioides]